MKLFLIIFAIAFVFFFLALGINYWALWGATAISFIIALIAIIIIALMTGQHDPFKVGKKNV